MTLSSGQVAVVTGAGSGIGKGMAQSFARRGLRLVLADVDAAALEAVRAELAAAGTEAIAVRTDVADPAAIQHLHDQTLEAYGAVDVLCNNAGVDSGGPIAEIPVSTWQWVLDVDLWSVIHACRIFLPTLIAQGGGHIVNTSSIAAYTAGPLSSAPYVAAKAALLALSKNLRDEMTAAKTGVQVSVLVPGPVRTNMPDSERARPSGVAAPPPSALRDGVQNFIKEFIVTGGMDPAEVGELVAESVATNRFFILTHPDLVHEAIEADLKLMKDEQPAS